MPSASALACARSAWDADKGFFLNGKSVKIKGTCNHHDHAGVGAALPDRLQWFRLACLKDMGGNAVRTSHNMPTPEWVEACDRLGMMMMCETRLMSANPRGHGATGDDGEALSQFAVDHFVVHGQRRVDDDVAAPGRARDRRHDCANSRTRSHALVHCRGQYARSRRTSPSNST